MAPKQQRWWAAAAAAAAAVAVVGTRRVAAQESILFGPIVAQEPLAECDLTVVCNGQFCADVCAEGSVVVDPWVTSTLAFQNELQAGRPINTKTWVGLHNGFISRANGMGLTEDLGAALFTRTLSSANSTLRVADQRYAITDLLNMGARHLEADIWSLDVVSGPAHICHSPVLDPLYGLALQASADALGWGVLDYVGDNELCSNMSFAAAMGRVAAWLAAPANSREVVGVFLDNRVPDYNIQTVVNDLTAVFGASLLTPGDLATMFGGVWPSTTAMLAHGKRVYVESNDYNPNNYTGTNLTTVAFYPTTWSAWQDDPDTVVPFPNCTITGSADWYGADWVRILEGTVVWYPDYDERSSGGIFERSAGIADMMACGVGNIGISNYGPELLPGLSWTWAVGEPRIARAARADAANCSAGALTTVRGRWTAQPCSAVLPAACRHGNSSLPAGNNPSAWSLTAPLPFAAAPAACAALGPGWAFDLPRDGRENALLAQNATMTALWRTSPGIWLNAPL